MIDCLRAQLATAPSFHELFLAVQTAIGGINGIGELMVYDTALRIGRHLGYEPDREYLHSGTRVGARRLGLATNGDWIMPRELPVALRMLPPWQVEDILCIFKDWFAGHKLKDSIRSCY